ncbi:MAG: protease modulator HflC [Gammaproteobacteria bacterium]|nr:protease modulator HflC [Gammaproteobacteria bacterium]
MSSNKMIGVLVLLAMLFVGSFSVFTVYEWERAVLFRLGEIVRADFEPGLHFKIPFINNVRKFDARVLTLDVQPERFLTAEKKNVIVDSFVKWRIGDLSRFYTAVLGDELQARLRLEQIVKDGMRGEFSKRTLNEVVSGERGQIMGVLAGNVSVQAKELGITIVDVRIKRVELPQDVNAAVYRRMEAERTRVAKDFRSRGFEASERIRADADRQREVILAEAHRDAERVRGEGDAKATDIYAEAYNKNPEFYAFYRSLNAYEDAFGGGDLLVLEPDSEFFRYFKTDQAQK